MNRVSEPSSSTPARADTGAAALLRVRDLSVRFKDTATPAVSNVSFDLARGETLGIVGESGSGKSVLTRALLGLTPASATVAGRADFDGRDLLACTPRELRPLLGRRIAMILQDPMTALNPVRRIERQLCDPMQHHLGLSRTEARARALELLELVRVPGAARRLRSYPHELSGGLRQRVLIAIALSCEPDMLIADEATTALDVTVQRQVLDLLSDLQQALDMALIVITHDLGVVANHTHRVAVMYAGRFVEVAETGSLFAEMRHPYTRALLASVPRLKHARHTELRALPGAPPSLNEEVAGCSFRPRCDAAFSLCEHEVPVLRHDSQSGHCVCCHAVTAVSRSSVSHVASGGV